MGNLLAYSGISTKIRAMGSQLLTDKDYQQLAYLSSVGEAVEYLRQKTAFKQAFEIVEEATLHRAAVERMLFFTEYFDFVKIYRFSHVKLRRFLNLYFLSYERHFLKSAFRAVSDQREADIKVTDLGTFFHKHAAFSCEKVSEARTIDELLEALRGSPYYEYLHPLQEQGAGLFDYETAIDTYVFSRMWKQIKKQFQGDDYETLQQTYGCQFDLLNLMWIYRSKKYYNLEKGEIYGLLLPIHHKLNKATVQRLVETANVEEFKAILEQTYYGNRYEVALDGEEQGFYIEKIYHGLLYHIHNREFRSHPFSAAAVNSYLYKKHLETERLITTIEGIRYGLPAQTIIEHERRYNLEVMNR